MLRQGATYASFIEKELDREYTRRDSLDARGASIVTVNSALLALVLSLRFLVDDERVSVRGFSAALVAVSLLLFVAAGILGLLANRSREYLVTSHKTMASMLGDHWKDHDVDASNICASLHLKTIDSLRSGNNGKAKLVTAALALQLGAVLALSCAIGPAFLNAVA